MATSNDFQVHSKQKNKTKPRAYIGNLRVSPDLKTKLFYFFQEKGFDKIKEQDIEVQKNQSCFVLVSCSNVDRLISKMNGTHFDGRKLVAQREQKKGDNKKPSFGGGWAAPTKPRPAPNPTQPTTATVDPVSLDIHVATEDSETDRQDNITLDDFRSRCQKPLSDLLSEFGEHDPDFKKVVVPAMPPVENQTSADSPQVTVNESNSQLGKHRKASLHVEFRSFGYIFSAPSSKGHSHSQPLPPLDCRDLPPVPPYLAHKPGFAFVVKRVLLTDELKTLSSTLADEVLDALVEAITNGHGYAMPLRMTINVGSDNGRHRSVLICEEAAKGLRYRLRKNVNNRIQVEVSVGTAHQDMDRKRDFGRAKQEDMDDDW